MLTKYDKKIKTTGNKISVAKKGKSTKPCSQEKALKISKTKKGKALTEEHKQSLRGIKKPIHTDEWKKQNSIRLKEQWESGIRNRDKGPMSDEQKKAISKKLLGIKRSDVSNYRTSHSKKYLITFADNTNLEVNGLKKYAIDNNIPYVSLSKASQYGSGLQKYNITNISVV